MLEWLISIKTSDRRGDFCWKLVECCFDDDDLGALERPLKFFGYETRAVQTSGV
jgi:hypothetical protein